MGNTTKSKNGTKNETPPAATEAPAPGTTTRAKGGLKKGEPRPPVRPLEERLAAKQKAIEFHEEKIAVLKDEMEAMKERASGVLSPRKVKLDALDDSALAELEKRLAEEKAKRAAAATTNGDACIEGGGDATTDPSGEPDDSHDWT